MLKPFYSISTTYNSHRYASNKIMGNTYVSMHTVALTNQTKL